MSHVRVFIATTAGLVAVQRITEEDPEVNSVVCLAGKAVALPISAAYEAFVRDPTGVIQRHFGHPAYRVDVSATVDEGYSWQLALFAAHGLVKAGRLAHPEAEAPLTIIATGEVNRDLHVLDVDHLAEKFGALPDQLAAIGADPARTVLAVPRGNADAVKAHLDAAEALVALEVMAVAHARELLDRIDITIAAGTAKPSPAETPPPARRRAGAGGGTVLVLLGLLIAAGAGAAGMQYSPELKAWAATWVPALVGPDDQAEPASPAPASAPAPAPAQADDTETAAAVMEEPKPSAAAPKASEPAVVSLQGLKAPVAQPAPQVPAADTEPLPVAPRKPVSKTTPKIAPAPQPAVKPAPKIAAAPEPRLEPRPMPAKAVMPSVDDMQPAPKTDVIETVRLRDLPTDPVELEIMELRAPPGYACADVRHGRIEPIEQVAPEKGPFAFGPSTMDNLCTVEITASAVEDGMYLFGRYHRWTKSRPGKGPPDKVIDLGPRRGEVHWSVDIPERLRRGAAFQVLIFASWSNFNVPKKLLAQIGTKPRSPDARKAVKRLKKRGIALRAVRFRVIPNRRAPAPTPPPRPSGNQSWLPNPGG